MEINVKAIENGTVIDHIPSESIQEVLKILEFDDDHEVVIAFNMSSKKMQRKAFLKINNKFLTDVEANKLALIAPNATINRIKNHELERKRTLEIPQELNNVNKCSNPKCITNAEHVPTKFYKVTSNPLTLRCHYCERIIEDIIL